MATRRQQLNLRIPAPLGKKIQMLSSFHGKSVNEWAVAALEEAADEEFKEHPVEELNQALAEVAERYLPGRTLSMAEMLALAEPYAADDTGDGGETRHAPGPRKPTKRK